MSGTLVSNPAATGFATSGLTDTEKADARRMCGYPTYGGLGGAGFQGWRFYQEYGLLEFRMNNLAPAEYQNVRYLLSVLYPIEAALKTRYQTLNVDTAGPFKRNRREVADARADFDSNRRDLCNAVGIPPGPLLGDGTLRVIV
jgi:hypothetical protein